jgi:hypothetical protein
MVVSFGGVRVYASKAEVALKSFEHRNLCG